MQPAEQSRFPRRVKEKARAPDPVPVIVACSVSVHKGVPRGEVFTSAVGRRDHCHDLSRAEPARGRCRRSEHRAFGA